MVLTWLAVLAGCTMLQETGIIPWKIFPTIEEYKPVLVDDCAAMAGKPQGSRRAGPCTRRGACAECRRNAAYLRNFFNALDELKAGKRERVRILHFGDSMIWGDNMTWPLKEAFQKEYGSAGRGIVPVVQTAPTALKGITNATRAADFNHDKLTHFYKYSHYYKLYPDTKDQFGFTGEGARPRSTNAVAAYRIPADQTAVTEARVFLHSNKFDDTPARQYTLELTTEHGSEQKTITLGPLTAGSVRFVFPEARTVNVRMAQYDKQAPYIDAVCLEGGRGIVYNTIVRMGVHLSWYGSIHRQFVQQALTELDPDLVIFQFGVNESASLDAVPPFKEDICEQQLHDWLTAFRQIRPATSVLFIGPIERLKNIDGKLVTMPAILQARGIQQRQSAAFKMAFIDNWTLMGGAGHMLTMVQNGWAIDDYTHITYRRGNNLARSNYELIDAAYKGHEAGQAKAEMLRQEREKNMAIQFNSKSYVFFFFIVILLSIAMRKVPGLRIVMLTAASYYFYMSWKLWPVTILIFSTVLDYCCGMAIDKRPPKGQKGHGFPDNVSFRKSGIALFFQIL